MVGKSRFYLTTIRSGVSITSHFEGETGDLLWKVRVPAQIQAGTVVTKGSILFAADTLGTLYAFNSKYGTLLKRIDTQGAINSGLISYAVDNKQYVAAEVGGLSLNPPGITDPLRPGSALRVMIFTLMDTKRPAKVVRWDRVPILKNATQEQVGARLYGVVCGVCLGNKGQGNAYPTLLRQYHILTDTTRLKEFFKAVPPPMPKLYPDFINAVRQWQANAMPCPQP